MTTDDQYVPDEEDVRNAYALEAARDTIGDTDYRAVPEARAEFDRFLARVRRDAAREALDGLYEDASQEYRIGLQGDDQERMDAAEAVLRATYEWMDNYPEENP